MKMIKNTIYIEDIDSYSCTGDNGVTFVTSDAQQREIISHLWKHKPKMVRDIICENCPEHL